MLFQKEVQTNNYSSRVPTLKFGKYFVKGHTLILGFDYRDGSLIILYFVVLRIIISKSD